MKRHAANLVTSLGLILSVWVAVLVWTNYPDPRITLLLIGLIGVTDLIDGNLARLGRMVSKLGASLDRLRDKVFVCPIFINFLTVVFWSRPGLATALIKAALICILVLELGLVYVWLHGLTRGLDASSHKAGKIKQVLYSFTILLWFVFRVVESELGYRLVLMEDLFMALLLSASAYYALGSLSGYINRYWPDVQK